MARILDDAHVNFVTVGDTVTRVASLASAFVHGRASLCADSVGVARRRVGSAVILFFTLDTVTDEAGSASTAEQTRTSLGACSS